MARWLSERVVTVAKLLTPTGLTGRSGLVRAYLAVGEKPLSVRLYYIVLMGTSEVNIFS